MTARIAMLPSHVVGQIAAGEVVERPASVVKELVENSLDARAERIDVAVVEGGRDLIRITDDGVGIAPEDLPLAVASHATSKIRSADDLFRVETMGFRGEALASIAGVSDFRLQSRPANQPTAARLEVRQGEVGPVVACGGPVGTQIEVRQLFASVPVRRKFLKSKQTELGHISESLIRLALARPGIDLRLSHNDRLLYHRTRDMDLRASVDLFFGNEVSQSLLAVEGEGEGLTLTGFVAEPSVHRPNQRSQYLFVNGRFIRDRSLGHAVQEAYRGLILSGRYPVTFLFLTVPADQVDVNVHPTKIEVRFEDTRKIFSLILSTLRERFLRADLSARWSAPARGVESRPASTEWLGARTSLNEEFSLSPTATPPQATLWSSPVESSWQKRPVLPGGTDDLDEELVTSPFASPLPLASADAPPERLAHRSFASVRNGSGNSGPDLPSPTASPQVAPASAPAGLVERVRAIQLHNSYLVVETSEGMMLVDQHALHERVLYEQFRRRVAGQGIEVQELLVPEPVDLTPMQAALLLEQKEVLNEIGLGIEEFGDRCVIIQRHPALLGRMTPTELVRAVASHLEETGQLPTRDDLLQNLLHMMACKAAVKAGDPLTPAEIEALVQQRHLVDDSHHCPHGRPTILRFTLGDLERQFMRK